MKITICNLGTIERAEIDLKPLTIFIGPNNTGKTWTAMALAGIFGPYGFTPYLDAYIQGEVSNDYRQLDEAVGHITKTGTAAIDMVQFANDYGDIYFNNVAHFCKRWLASFMGTDLVSFDDLDVSMDLLETKENLLNQMLNASLRGDIIGAQEKSTFTIRKARGKRELYAYISQENTSSDEIEKSIDNLPPEIIKEFLVQNVLRTLHRAVYPHVRIFPTERTTFISQPYQLSKSLRKKASNQTPTSQEQKIRGVSGPVSYFLLMMENAFNRNSVERKDRETEERNNRRIREYVQLARLAEEQILGGEVKYSQTQPPTQSSNPEILFQPTNGKILEVSVASSMVKELSSLLIYLRLLANPGELIIIDEPEMNLHPEAQAKLVEFLAILVNSNLNVILTTHSPYITDHLSNLIKASEVENKENIRDEFYLKRTDAFIPKDKVAVYLIDKGQISKAIDGKGIIDLDTFGQVSDHISDIYFSL